MKVDNGETPTRRLTWIQGLKYTASLSLLTFCLYLIVRGMFARQSPVSQSANPVVALVAMLVLLFWLGVLEGGQGSIVGLQPVPSAHYQTSHPTAHKITTTAHHGDNLNRFIVGRQFLVVLVVFALNLCTTTVEGAHIPGCYQLAVDTLLSSGLASMFITVLLGQLSAEVNATNCMLDFINSYTVYWTTIVCLAMEESGLLHAVYVMKWFFSNDPSEDPSWSIVWYRVRMFFSMLLLAGALAVTWVALCENETTMGLSPFVSLPLFVGIVCGLGILEAMQIAVFAVVKLPPKMLDAVPVARANCDLVFAGDNFKAFLIGRQICVTTCMFLLARLTTTNVSTVDLPPPPPLGAPPLGPLPLDPLPPPPPTVLGVAPAVQAFFNTGLPGALITTIVASLYWRILAASFPVAFMGSPVVNWTIRICLWLEASGAFSSAWLLADGIRWMVGLKPDDWYLGQRDSITETSSLLTEITRADSGDSLGYDSV